VFVLLLREIDHCSGAFSFYVILLLFWLCASIMLLGHCFVAEARCNWYLFYINVFPLSEKKSMNTDIY
jgi:hypothetical protein